MCTGIVESAKVTGSGKVAGGWLKLDQVNVSFDHPFDVSLEHSLNIDFVNHAEGPSSRIAVELSPESARRLVEAILSSLKRGEVEVARGSLS